MPWESGGTSLPRRAFPGPGTTHTLGLTPSLMPWEHPTPSKAHHCPRSFRLAPHAILFKTLQAKETWIHSLPTSAFPSLGRREAWIGWPQKGQNVPKSPRFLNKTKHGHGNAVVGGGGGGGSHRTLPASGSTSWGAKSQRTKTPSSEQASHGHGA